MRMEEEARQIKEDKEQWLDTNKKAISACNAQVRRYHLYENQPGIRNDLMLDTLIKCVEFYKGGSVEPLKELMKDASKQTSKKRDIWSMFRGD